MPPQDNVGTEGVSATPARVKDNNAFSSDTRPSNRNPNFIRDYFQSSRLHFIGSFRARYESMMVAIAKRLKVSPGSLIAPAPRSTSRERVIIHVDMDCFFASVAVKRDPSLRGKCVAVCHGGGEISSCSYEAREFGVRAGMFAKDARKLCPQLLSVPYHFPSYEEISIQIYSLFYDYPGVHVEAVSVDEAYLDATEAVGADKSQLNAENLAENIRSRIKMETGCTASAGIGPSKLIARLATKAAKPNGQLRVRPEKVIEYIDTLEVRDLPGVGWRTSKKMTELGIKGIPDLRSKSLSFLQSKFGDRQGHTFFELARAIDRRPVEPLKPRKSIGAEASWGIRFDQDEDEKLQKFITDMASEVASRVANAGASGSKMAVKLYRKKPNSSMMGYKFLGHGPCTIVSRIYNLPRNCGTQMVTNALRNSCNRVLSETKMRNNEFRGIGLQVLDLKFGDLKFDHSRTTTTGIKRIDSFFTAANNEISKGPDQSSNRRVKASAKDVKIRSSQTLLRGDKNGEKNHEDPFGACGDEIEPEPVKNKDIQRRNELNDRHTTPRKESEVVPIDVDNDEIEIHNVDDDHAALLRQAGSSLTQRIPEGWDKAVFKALPYSLRKELVENKANQSLANAEGGAPEKPEHGEAAVTGSDPGDEKKWPSIHKRNKHVTKLSKRPRKRQKAQVTMTQFADIRELRNKGNDVLNAEEFRSKPLMECIELLQDLNHGRRHSALAGRRRCNAGKKNDNTKAVTITEQDKSDRGRDKLDIPSPPSMSSDSDSNGGDKILKIVQREGVEHKQIYESEDIVLFSENLFAWMKCTAGEVKSAHVELLRGRLMEHIRLKELEQVSANVRLLRRFAESECMKGWRYSINTLLQEVQDETRRQHGLNLILPPLFSNFN